MVIYPIYEWAIRQPHKIAVVRNGVNVDYLTLATRIESLRQRLASENLLRRSTAIVLIQDMIKCWIAIVALRSLGLTTIWVRSPQEATQLHITNVSCVVTTETDAKHHPVIMAANHIPQVILIEKAETTAFETAPDFSSVLARQTEFGNHILYTSGTTGTPKKLLMPASTEARRAQRRSELSGYDGNTSLYIGNSSLASGTGFKTFTAIGYLGATIMVDQRANAHEFLKDYRMNILRTSPQLFKQLAENGSMDSFQNASCTILSASSLMSEGVMSAFRRRITLPLRRNYGPTEFCGPVMSKWIEGVEDVRRLRPNEGFDVQIVDDQGEPVKAGSSGRLRIALGELDSREYLGDPATSEKAFVDGYFYPGDMAVHEADGHIRILGRIDDVIFINGWKAASGPVEERLRNSLAVSDVCVFTHINIHGQEELIIALEAQALPDKAQVAKIRSDSHLKHVEHIRCVASGAFPRTASGKVQRALLKEMCTEKQGVAQ